MNSHEKPLVSVVTQACSIEATSSESQNTSIPTVAPVEIPQRAISRLKIWILVSFTSSFLYANPCRLANVKKAEIRNLGKKKKIEGQYYRQASWRPKRVVV